MKHEENTDFIGHASVRDFLLKSSKKLRHHAYLLAGPAGAGKDTAARDFVGFLAGKKIASWSQVAVNPDICVLSRDPEKKFIGVAELRAFEARFALTSATGAFKIGVILGAHDLSVEAANAFLKTLEEPPGRAVFVLVADDLAKIPMTVQSRTAVLRFLPVPDKEITAALVARGYGRDEATAAAREAMGLPGIALSLLADQKTAQARRAALVDFFCLLSQPLAQRLNTVQALVEEKKTGLAPVLNLWLSALRDLLLVKTGNAERLSNVSVQKEIFGLADRLSREKIIAGLDAVLKAKKFLAANVNARLLIENIALTI